MSLLFSPFGERAWVGPGICGSESVEQIVCSLPGQVKRKSPKTQKKKKATAEATMRVPRECPTSGFRPSICLFFTNLCPNDVAATCTTWPAASSLWWAVSAHPYPADRINTCCRSLYKRKSTLCQPWYSSNDQARRPIDWKICIWLGAKCSPPSFTFVWINVGCFLVDERERKMEQTCPER